MTVIDARKIFQQKREFDKEEAEIEALSIMTVDELIQAREFLISVEMPRAYINMIDAIIEEME